jgi:hypothetical protein
VSWRICFAEICYGSILRQVKFDFVDSAVGNSNRCYRKKLSIEGKFQWNLRKYAQLESAIVIMLIAIGLAQNENYSRVEAKGRN